MAPTIRHARPEDLTAIQDIERASARRFVGLMDAIAADEPTPLATLAARRDAGGLRVATVESSLAAFVMFRPVESSLYIEQIDVLPTFERQRLGAALIDAVAAEGRSTGLASLTLSTFREIPWNAPYYRRLGFCDIADMDLSPGLLTIRRDHLARGLDESARVFMRRPL